jgi:pyridoxamine 5'-phosphate oxidase
MKWAAVIGFFLALLPLTKTRGPSCTLTDEESMDTEPVGAPDGLRSVLRGLPVLQGRPPAFDPARAPDDPESLFAEWLGTAVRLGVTEPHAMTVATVDRNGEPNARVLILKAVDRAGWHFAVSSVSQKGADLAAHRVAALTFYWPELVRQVRVRGAVTADPPEVSAADFLARSDGSRAMALTRRQSQPFLDPGELDQALDKACSELRASPRHVPDEWISYAVQPGQVEFWQGDPGRRHQRLLYVADPDAETRWTRTLLWP